MIGLYRRAWGYLEPRHRRAAIGLLLSLASMPAIEFMGIGMVLLFVQYVTDPTMVQGKEWFTTFRNVLGIEQTDRALFYLGIVTFLALVARNAAAMFNVWILALFSNMMTRDLSCAVVRGYMGQPVTFFNNVNTATLNKNILTEVNNLVSGRIIAAFTLASDALMVVVIAGGMLWYEPMVTMAALLLVGGLYGGLTLVLRNLSTRLGRERLKHADARFRAASHALSGIRETKVLGREGYFIGVFEGVSSRLFRVLIVSQLIGQLPRYILETLIFGGIIVLVLVQMRTGAGSAEVIGLVTFYAVAAYRLMPVLDRMFKAVTTIRTTRAVSDELHQALQAGFRATPALPPSRERLPFRREVTFHDVSFRYIGGRESVLHEVSLTIERNTSHAFVGPSGVGKSTLANVLMGLLQPSSGRVVVDDVTVDDSNVRQWQNNIGYVPQDIFLADDTVERNIAFGVLDDELDRDAVRLAACMAHLDGFVEKELADGYNTVIGERGVRLSGGQRQRIGIARALYHDPSLLILDEATSSLDGITERIITQAIRELSGKKTVVVIAHRLSTVQYCDVVHVMSEGRVVESGTYDHLLTGDTLFRRLADGA